MGLEYNTSTCGTTSNIEYYDVMYNTACSDNESIGIIMDVIDERIVEEVDFFRFLLED